MKKFDFRVAMKSLGIALVMTLIIVVFVTVLSIGMSGIIQHFEPNEEQLTSVAAEEVRSGDEWEMVENISSCNTNELMVIDNSQITEEMLISRNGKLIIDKVIGKCINDEGDGTVLNNRVDDEYISYRKCKDIKKNDIVVTYLIYNPDSAFIDDILYRFDYVVARDNLYESQG